ncbi:DNA polymerase lambda-like isoform X4 [Anneissia japonica]|uniref:DNA polymerase lambda-like isoform X4 n=1 Tax=Anneissia japonica TaxID=1529436 RepID=UPI001425AE91|nr:DNA polymerase lambda-like isoform X4 [Anneissia japonica]
MEFSCGFVKSTKQKNKRKRIDGEEDLAKGKSSNLSGGAGFTKKIKIKKMEIEQQTKKDDVVTGDYSSGFLSGIFLFILKAGSGMGKARCDIFTKQVHKNGGKVTSEITPKTSHVLVAEEMTPARVFRILNLNKYTHSENIKFVKANWLSETLSEQKIVDTTEFELDLIDYVAKIDKKATIVHNETIHVKELSSVESGKLNKAPSTGSKWTSPKKDAPKEEFLDSDDSSYVPSDDDDYQHLTETDRPTTAASSSTISPPASHALNKLPKGDWVCAKPSTTQPENVNKHITDKLQILQQAYENTKDQWRAFGYKKAINALKKHPTKVTSWEEANRIPGVGSKLADKIIEIVESGHLRKIDHVCKGEEMEALNKFNNIWGVGPTTAQGWVQQGYRTLDDVMKKATLNRQQTIGMKYYDEFLDRMPREEVEEIQRVVTETAHEIDSGYVLTTCGSFRRGKPTCGDIDILVSHPDGKSHKGILGKLLDALRLKHSDNVWYSN